MRTKLVIAASGLAFCASIAAAQENPGYSAALAKLSLFGAKIERHESAAGRPVVAIDLSGSDRFGDAYVSLLDPFVMLERLDLSRTALTDSGLKRSEERRVGKE